MKNQLLIPDKIKVGYQKRNDTYTQKLAYIIYYDKKGKLHKEKSFEEWRHKDIQTDEFENKPHSGFILNKDVKRSSEWFGNGRNMIRVYDDRGMEFEITTGNLLFILMTTNCHKRGLEGEFVYAWSGKDLVLLPVGCDEYTNSVEFTELKTKNVKMKNLIEGCSYLTKTQDKVIYLGKFDWLNYNPHYLNKNDYNIRAIFDYNKKFIFLNTETNKFLALENIQKLAIQISEIPVSNYAELVDDYSKSIYSTKVSGFFFKEKKYDLDTNGKLIDLDNKETWSFTTFMKNNNEILKYNINQYIKQYDSNRNPIYDKINIIKSSSIKIENGNVIETSSRYYNEGYETLSFTELSNKYNFNELYISFENGSSVIFDDIYKTYNNL